jgi:hypothetical protein
MAALAGHEVRLQPPTIPPDIPTPPFDAGALEYAFPSTVAAKLAIADALGQPLAKLPADDRACIDPVLAETLMQRLVFARIREDFRRKSWGGEHAGCSDAALRAHAATQPGGL